MKLGTISTDDNPQPRLGVRLDGGKVLDVAAAAAHRGGASKVSTTLKAHLENIEEERDNLEGLVAWATGAAADAGNIVFDESEIRFHPPVPDPVKFLCVGKNYAAHLDELKRNELIKEMPDEPTGFIKLNEVMIGHGGSVARPKGIVKFDYEPEVAFVMGKQAYKATRENALDHVFGVTLFNDLTAREIQQREVRSGTRFWTAKNMPGFAPIGPWVITLDEIDDIDDLDIACLVNGEHRMGYNTRDQINKLPDVIEHFSKYMPIHPGDIFAMGSAAGVAVGQPNADELFLKPGDTVEVRLDDVMSLSTEIVEQS